MPNINKIRLSGQTYDIQDPNASKTVELTQAAYDALVEAGTVDPNTFYIITDATAGDLSNYYTKSETDDLLDTKLDASAYTPTDLSNYYTKSETSGATEISTALASKQDTLVSGTNIKTINNESILGSGNIEIQGGGKAVAAGTNISITTGETADTINCTLPLSATGANNKSVIGGRNCSATNNYSFVYGDGNKHTVGSCGVVFGSSCTVENNYTFAGGLLSNSKKEGSFTYGQYVIANNKYEHSVGQYNNSVSASAKFGNSGNTLFSVGNGTSSSARHNAFEIRQNGDIYCSDGTNDVKLQDTITATAANTAALGGLKLVKLSQSEYDSLSTKDNSTLYVIVN